MKPARLRCLRGICKNRVVFRNDIAVTCEGPSCKNYIREIPEETVQSIGTEYITACRTFKATGYLDDFTEIQNSLVQKLTHAHDCLKTLPPSPAPSDADCSIANIKKKLASYLYSNNLQENGSHMWAAMGWPPAEFETLRV